MIKPKPASQIVAESRSRTGARQSSVSLSPEEQKLWDRLAERFGSKKAALVAGLRALEDQGALTRAALLAEIERRLT